MAHDSTKTYTYYYNHNRDNYDSYDYKIIAHYGKCKNRMTINDIYGLYYTNTSIFAGKKVAVYKCPNKDKSDHLPICNRRSYAD